MFTTTLHVNISDQNNTHIVLSVSKAQARVLELALSNFNLANLDHSEHKEWSDLIRHIRQINVRRSWTSSPN